MVAKRNKQKVKLLEPLTSDEKIKFSFRYYDTTCNDFCLSSWGSIKIAETLKKLQDINNKTYNEINSGRTTYHFHPVSWEQTIKKNGFPLTEVNRLSAFQFALIGVNSGKARVYGALYQNTFFIVWFDLEHTIWPSFKSHT